MRAALVPGLLLCTSALAGDPAWYNPDEVAQRSARFGEAAASVGPAFEAAQGQLSKLGRDLQQLELSVALLGPRATGELRAWDEDARKRVNGQFLAVQRHVDLLQDDYSRVFQAALDRALPRLPGGAEAKPCQSQGISAMMGRKPACEGADLSAKLAEAVDADPTLARELADIASVPWPGVGLEPRGQAVAPLTGAARWVSVSPLVESLAPGWLAARTEALEDQLAPLEYDLDAGDEAAISKAAALKAAWRADLGEAASPLIETVTAALSRAAARDGSLAEVGLCANPASLGGCPGEDISAAALPVLSADRKVSREAGRLSTASAR